MDQDSTCAVCIPNQDPVEAPPTVVENVLDPSTFIPPTLLPGPSVTIEFCDRVCSIFTTVIPTLTII